MLQPGQSACLNIGMDHTNLSSGEAYLRCVGRSYRRLDIESIENYEAERPGALALK